jgi:hypothetical protein
MRKLYLLILPFLVTATISAQQKINGLVEDDATGEPVSYASVMPGKGDMIITDSSGKFALVIRRQPRSGDSLFISAIGYFPKRVALKDLLTNNKIKLSQQETVLDQVKIFASIKGDERKFGYFREWKVKGDGSEIGFIFEMPKKQFQIGQVQVKINHNYDTCWLKLHLRNVGFIEPEKEITHKETILPTTIKNGLVEFDLNWEDVSITSNKMYVGFEIVKCGCTQSTAPSFFFMGNEEGKNFYKESWAKKTESSKNNNNKDTDETSPIWKIGVDYTIYVRLTTK